MSLNLEADQRYAWVERTPYILTKRFACYVYLASSDRSTMLELYEPLFSFRYCRVVSNPLVSEISCVTEGFEEHSDERSTIIETPVKQYTERSMLYVLGSQSIVFSVPAHLSITYGSDRSSYYELLDTFSQRVTAFRLGAFSEIPCVVSRVRKNYTYSNTVSSSLQFENERSVYLEMNNAISQRNVALRLGAVSDVSCFVSMTNQGIVFATDTKSSISEISSQRWMYALFEVTYSERYTLSVGCGFSERATTYNVRMYTERSIEFRVHQMNALFANSMRPYKPYIDEKLCDYITADHSGEVQMYVEQRPLYVKRNPRTISNSTGFFSELDNASQISITSDRGLDVYSGTGTGSEEVQSSSYSKTVFAAGMADFTVTGVDSKGASVTTTGDDQEMKLKLVTYFNLEITLT